MPHTVPVSYREAHVCKRGGRAHRTDPAPAVWAGVSFGSASASVPCRTIKPRLEWLAAQYAGKVELVRVNADEQPETAGAFGEPAIATLIAFHAGREVRRRTGAPA